MDMRREQDATVEEDLVARQLGSEADDDAFVNFSTDSIVKS